MNGPAPVKLRAAEERDAAAIVALWTTAYVEEGEGGRTAPYSERDFAETAARGRVTVAERLGEVAGIVALAPPGSAAPAVAEPDEGELSRLAVSPGHRRLGIGRLLVADCAVVARAAGWPAIALWSRPYQVAAHRLYESLGYQRLPGRDRDDETGHGRRVFRLDLRRSE